MRLLWPWTGPPDASRYAELQYLPRRLSAAWLVAAVVLVWWLGVLGAIVLGGGFAWVVGWKRRWIRIDDDYLRIGFTAFAPADVVEARAVSGKELLRFADPLIAMGPDIGAPSNRRVQDWLPTGVIVRRITPEGGETRYGISSRRSEDLIAALVAGPVADDTRGMHSWPRLPDRDPWTHARSLYRTSAGQTRFRRRQPMPAWLRLVVVLLPAPALFLIEVSGRGGWMTYGLAAGVPLGLLVRSLRRVEVRGGVLRVGGKYVDLAALRSARIVVAPELRWLRFDLNPVGGFSAAPLWLPGAVLLTMYDRDAEAVDEQPTGRLPVLDVTMDMAVVGTRDPAGLLAAVIAARADVVHPLPGSPT